VFDKGENFKIKKFTIYKPHSLNLKVPIAELSMDKFRLHNGDLTMISGTFLGLRQ
jgi:hypothetical protein